MFQLSSTQGECHVLHYVLDECQFCLFLCIFFYMARLEYEHKRGLDISSRITKLEATLANLRSALKNVEERETELKYAADKYSSEIDQLKEEVLGNY